MNLGPRDERTKEIDEMDGVRLLARIDRVDDVSRRGERAPSARRVPASKRQRVDDRLRIGEDRFEAFDDEASRWSAIAVQRADLAAPPP